MFHSTACFIAALHAPHLHGISTSMPSIHDPDAFIHHPWHHSWLPHHATTLAAIMHPSMAPFMASSRILHPLGVPTPTSTSHATATASDDCSTAAICCITAAIRCITTAICCITTTVRRISTTMGWCSVAVCCCPTAIPCCSTTDPRGGSCPPVRGSTCSHLRCSTAQLRGGSTHLCGSCSSDLCCCHPHEVWQGPVSSYTFFSNV